MIFQYKNINKLKNKFKGFNIILIGGSFDLLHQGHLDFINKAKKYGDKLIVMVQSDKYITLNKGKGRPVYNQKLRAQILDSLKFIDGVILIPNFLYQEKLPISIIIKLKPNVYLTRRIEWRQFKTEFEKNDIKLCILKSKTLNSSTSIFKKIQAL